MAKMSKMEETLRAEIVTLDDEIHKAHRQLDDIQATVDELSAKRAILQDVLNKGNAGETGRDAE